MVYLIGKTEAVKIFDECSRKIGIYDNRDRVNDLVIYELTDGTRTSTNLRGWQSYFDGSLFILRLINIMNHLGSRNFYVLTTGESHRVRDNYADIMKALANSVDVYRTYAKENNIRLKFIGDIKTGKFLKTLQKIEAETVDNKGLTVHVLIDYSFDWAIRYREQFQELPNANVIVKHTKGQVNDGLWLPGKLQNNSFVYVQNASASVNWSDKGIIWLIAIALRSMLLHEGLQYGKSYTEAEAEEIKLLREEKLSMVHKRMEPEISKRIIIFSAVGPEIFEF